MGLKLSKSSLSEEQRVSNKEEFLRQMESQINVWRTQLAQIGSKSKNLDETRREKIEEEYHNLQKQICSFKKNMGAIAEANRNGWRKLEVEARYLRKIVGRAIGEIAAEVNKVF